MLALREIPEVNLRPFVCIHISEHTHTSMKTYENIQKGIPDIIVMPTEYPGPWFADHGPEA